MSGGITTEIGINCVSLARNVIENYLTERSLNDVRLDVLPNIKRGVFVSLYSYPSKELRGCIGHPYPSESFATSLIKVALAAALEDPRFPPLTREELGSVIVEVSLLTEPEIINISDRRRLPEAIKIGRDGLILESRYGSALLLPQVPLEFKWDAEDFLTNLCLKAGLEASFWLEKEAVIKRFSADVFAEVSPRGEITRVELGTL